MQDNQAHIFDHMP